MFAVFIIYLNVYICGLLFTLAEMWYIGTPYLPLQQINNKVHQWYNIIVYIHKAKYVQYSVGYIGNCIKYSIYWLLLNKNFFILH